MNEARTTASTGARREVAAEVDPRRFGSSTLATLLLLCCGLPGCRDEPSLADLPLFIPTEADWHTVGTVLEAGPEGTWDHILAGASTPSAVIQRNGEWLLYYGGAVGARKIDGGPKHRAIGLATSSDGVRFEKYGDAPVVSHLPTGGEEEGANSAALSVGAGGDLVMHYGAATQFREDQIHADARVARSADGRRFEDTGRAMSRSDPTVYGYGDELFPIASYRFRGRWFVFYLPNGSPQGRDLAVAWGPTERALTHSRLVLDGSKRSPARCAANVIVVGDHVIVFVQRGWHPDVRAEVRVAPANAPWRLGPPLRTWDGPLWREGTKFFTVALDRTRATWMLYRLDWKNRFVLHTAPTGERDGTPPDAPREVRAVRNGRTVHLAWEAARDPETGVGQYRIRCGGALVAEPLGAPWSGELGAGGCALSAMNLHGLEGPGASFDAGAEPASGASR